MLQVTPSLSIPFQDLRFEFIHASGPGGQNVNKLATAVQLRYDVRNSSSIPEDVKARLIHLAGSKISTDGILLILAKRYRSQERNRTDALERFSRLVLRASELPRPRRPTQPGPAARQRRLASKKHRSTVKRLRQAAGSDDE
jgi:ribosome-associated protein